MKKTNINDAGIFHCSKKSVRQYTFYIYKYRSEQAKIDRICAYRNLLTINISKQYDLIDLFWLITTLVIDQFFSLHFKLKLAYSSSSCSLLPLRARCHTL